jgi:hypothetical protein
MDRCIPVLPVQGLQEGRALDHQSPSRHHSNFVLLFPVNPIVVVLSMELVADILTG